MEKKSVHLNKIKMYIPSEFFFNLKKYWIREKMLNSGICKQNSVQFIKFLLIKLISLRIGPLNLSHIQI